MSDIRFATISRFPGYRFGADGTVWSKLTNRGAFGWAEGTEWKMNSTFQKKNKGYLATTIRGKQFLVHRLIAEAFHGPCPAGMECCHNNGIRHDNRESNLRWGTRSENFLDKRAHGTAGVGELNSASKLTNEQALDIRRRYWSSDATQVALAEEHGVTQACVWGIVHGVTYANC